MKVKSKSKTAALAPMAPQTDDGTLFPRGAEIIEACERLSRRKRLPIGKLRRQTECFYESGDDIG